MSIKTPNDSSGQQFIGRNRAPRVQIEYDVEIYGSQEKVELPFIMGVMSDLVGKSNVELPDLSKRKFMETDIDNFDERMKSLKPRVSFQVDNTLTNDGKLNIELEFESIDDFLPNQIARKVEPLNQLLQARTELSNLLSYMDGKSGAEELISMVLQDNDLLSTLSAQPKNNQKSSIDTEQSADDKTDSTNTDADADTKKSETSEASINVKTDD